MLLKMLMALTLLFTSSFSSDFKKGKKIYSIMCDKEKVSALSYDNTRQLKEALKSSQVCGNLNTTNLEALVLFLTSEDKNTSSSPLIVPKHAKCPVCGMFIAKYPKWVAIIEMQSGKKLYFDGVKDMMKFYFDPQQFHHKKEALKNILVSDYYTLKSIPAKDAYYVIGSNIYGPMGEELIPFKTKADAVHFKMEHHGKKVITFDTIEEKFLY